MRIPCFNPCIQEIAESDRAVLDDLITSSTSPRILADIIMQKIEQREQGGRGEHLTHLVTYF